MVHQYAEHPDCGDLFLGDWSPLATAPEDIGWSNETMIIKVGQTRVGYVYWHIDRGNDYVDQLGIFVAPPFQNSGAGIVAGAGLFKYLLKIRGFRKLEFMCTMHRAQLYERSGLKPLGVKRKMVKMRNGKYADISLFEVFKQDLRPSLLKAANRVKFYEEQA